jgi:hypothetical protein
MEYYKKVNFDYGFGDLGFGTYIYEHPSNKILKFIPQKDANRRRKKQMD